jgi:hypothetical protein
MRTRVKETPENRGIISLRGTLNPSTFPRAGLMPPRVVEHARIPVTARTFSVQAPEDGEAVSPGPVLQILQSDHFSFT